GACHDNGFKVTGTACGDSSSGQCDNADTSEEGGACQENHVAAGTNCGESDRECANQDKCDGGGAWHDNGFKVTGTACGDSSSGQCDNADTCNGGGACQDNHVAAGTNCGDTVTECTNQDRSDGGGACHDNGFKVTGTACGDSSSGQCDNAD